MASLAVALLLAIILFCACRRKMKGCWESSANSNKSRIPLYATGSSFSESLIYEKQMEGERHPTALRKHPTEPSGKFSILQYPSAVPVSADMLDNASEYYASILLPPHVSHRLSTNNMMVANPCPSNSCYECERIVAFPTMTNHPVSNCPVACPPYMARRMYTTNSRSRSNSCSRPPSFDAPPPPPSAPPPPTFSSSTLHRVQDYRRSGNYNSAATSSTQHLADRMMPAEV